MLSAELSVSDDLRVLPDGAGAATRAPTSLRRRGATRYRRSSGCDGAWTRTYVVSGSYRDVERAENAPLRVDIALGRTSQRALFA